MSREAVKWSKCNRESLKKAFPNALEADGIEAIGLWLLSRVKYGWQQKYDRI